MRKFPTDFYLSGPRNYRGRSAGSGVVVDAKQGYIVTNAHVIENADEITVTLQDDRTFSAEIIGTDPGSDLAVLKIDVPAEELAVAELGESSTLQVGQREVHPSRALSELLQVLVAKPEFAVPRPARATAVPSYHAKLGSDPPVCHAIAATDAAAIAATF